MSCADSPATMRRRAARAVGRPETPRMTNRLGAASGALMSMLFVLLFEIVYSKHMKINAFCMSFHAPRGPTYGRPPGRCQRTCDLNVFCVLASLLCACAENLWKRLYFSSLRTSCIVLHAFPLDFLICWTVVVYDLGTCLCFFCSCIENIWIVILFKVARRLPQRPIFL